MPGEYKAMISFGDLKDSTMITIKSDPRVGISEREIAARVKMIKDYDKVVKAGADALNQLKDAKKKVQLVGKMTEVLKDSLKTEIVDLNKTTIKEIDSLMNIFTDVGETKGIVRDPAKLSSIIRTPSRYLRSSWGVPGDNAMNTVKTSTRETEAAIEKINSYISNEWVKYMESINKVDFELFDEMKAVKIE
jgi:hypothetical protein